MKRNTKTGKTGEEKAAPAARPGKGADKPGTPPKAKTRSDKPAGDRFDFIGRVESLVVRGGPGAGLFEFGLRGRDGSRQTFRLKTSDSFSLNVIAPIVIAAHASEAKIGVRAAADEGGVPYVTEMASRPKLGKVD